MPFFNSTAFVSKSSLILTAFTTACSREPTSGPQAKIRVAIKDSFVARSILTVLKPLPLPLLLLRSAKIPPTLMLLQLFAACFPLPSLHASNRRRSVAHTPAPRQNSEQP